MNVYKMKNWNDWNTPKGFTGIRVYPGRQDEGAEYLEGGSFKYHLRSWKDKLDECTLEIILSNSNYPEEMLKHLEALGLA